MARIATSLTRVAVAVAAAVVLTASAAAATGGSLGLSLGFAASSWQVGDFPAVRLYGAFGSLLETAIRDAAEPATMAFADQRVPAWFRPQPQPTPMTAEVSGAPGRAFLDQNYPNPFNPSTMIRYGVPSGTHVKLTVHSLLGNQIRTLVDQWHEAGTYTFDFVAAELPSGAYFYRLQTDAGTLSRRMVISK
jgi:hypothetical protein